MTKRPKTGGRQKGSKNKATLVRELKAKHGIEAAEQSGITPLELMLTVMRGGPAGEAISDAQFEAAVAAAPYYHAKLRAIVPEPAPDPWRQLSTEELQAFLAEMAGREDRQRIDAMVERLGGCLSKEDGVARLERLAGVLGRLEAAGLAFEDLVARLEVMGGAEREAIKPISETSISRRVRSMSGQRSDASPTRPTRTPNYAVVSGA